MPRFEMMATYPRIFIILAILVSSHAYAQDKEHRGLESEFAEFVEPDFPFITHTLDARHLGGDWPKDNLVPRGIIVDLGEGHHGCFDTDLLRWAVIWKENDDGEWLTMRGMSTGSYRLPNRKASSGQDTLPRPIGTPILATKREPGFVIDGKPWDDQREKSIDEEELGLGPISPKYGRFSGIEILGGGVLLHYTIGDRQIQEAVHVSNGKVYRNWETLNGSSLNFKFTPTIGAKIESSTEPVSKKHSARWPDELTTKAVLGEGEYSLTHDEVTLPLPNPWKRNVRLSGFDFFSDGRAAFSTFDGDVWLVEGLGTEKLDKIVWRRICSGLHEPIALEIVDEKIYVFDRNGIQRLNDKNGDGQIDYIENFCNLIPQTAETREMANDMQAKPGGGFYISKGGQVGSTRGKHNGTICEIAPDGRSFKVIATGLRMPYIGVDPDTGLLTSSDQQGNWKPATPLRTVREGEYYGFQPAKFKENVTHPKPITEPDIWIPHFANQSGASQVWARNAKMGPFNDALIHIGYNRPEVFRAFFDPREGARQGAVVSLVSGLDAGMLKARIHPVDGQLYTCGFKIWGTVGEKISGLYRFRYQPDKPNPAPIDVRSAKRGVLLKFSEKLDPAIAENLANYTVDRWNYLRSHKYGSGNYKLDGEPGQEAVGVASARLSDDQKSIFLGIPDMKKVQSLRVTYKLPLASTATAPLPTIQSAYLTVHQLLPIDLAAEGFADNQVDLTLKTIPGVDPANIPAPTPESGKALATQYGCIACHSTDGKAPAGATAQQVGPTWKGLWGSKRIFTDGTIVKSADATYLKESIVDPSRMVAEGYEIKKTGVGMPSYLGVLKDHEIDSIILFIKSLKK